MYLHCQQCGDERPADVSPRDWARLNVGPTDTGTHLQVWCVRHDRHVAFVRLAKATEASHDTEATDA
jgi:hypothetical protein